MPDEKRPADLTLTLRHVPTDVVAAVKRQVMEHNLAHPTQRITQTDVIAWAVRAWINEGNHLPSGAGGE